MELKFLWVQHEVEEARVRVRKVAGFDNTTDVAAQHVDAATLAHCHIALGLIIFAGKFGGAEAAGEEDDSVGSALLALMTLLAAVGVSALFERLVRAASYLCRGSKAAPAAARIKTATQTEPLEVASQPELPASTRSSAGGVAPPSAFFVARYGECVHGSSSCRGVAPAKYPLREVRVFTLCMPRRG
jgi:hypothetical protein